MKFTALSSIFFFFSMPSMLFMITTATAIPNPLRAVVAADRINVTPGM